MRARRLALAALSALAWACPAIAEATPRAPSVWITDDGARVRRADIDSPLARGEANPVWSPGAPVRLAALRDETIAFQVIVEAGDAPLTGVTVDLDALEGPGEAARVAPDAPIAPIEIDRFIEHYVDVTRRSSNEKRPRESLGWSPRARPPDDRVLGALPDALIPVDLAAPFCPYPQPVAARKNGAVWIDLTIPRAAAPGLYRGAVVVKDKAAGEIARVPVELTVEDATLPYEPVSFLAFYGYYELEDRIGDAAIAERRLLQLLHRHHVDAFVTLNRPEDADRLTPALDGSLFTPAQGYVGPGQARPLAAVALGAYGVLGKPTPETLRKVESIVPKIPAAVEDVLLYAVDEDCQSPLGPAWRRALQDRPALGRVKVAHSCPEDPRKQDVDLVLVAANQFRTEPSRQARAMGRRVWVYNGALPQAGTLLLDADPTSLRASAWIAATHEVERWFLWETTFWNDDNKGGQGPIDPFITAESFHNQDGDTALGDGMLLYPGAQRGRFAQHSLGYAGVLPSIRLKNLRRGIQDAGYVALARAAHPTETDAIVAQLIPAALDEVNETAATPFPTDGAAFAAARAALRRLISQGASLAPTEVTALLQQGRSARRARLAAEEQKRWLVYGGVTLGTIALFTAALLIFRRRRKPEAPAPRAA